jgi:two-component system response regulator GlrR
VSRAAGRALDQATAAARSDLAVLIRGPDGAGKTYAARAIHSWGDRAEGPFVERSCAALPEALQAREIFGCAAGVHAMVPGEYEGALAQAAGGTLVLSEVERLRPDVRTALVQAIGQGTFRREGDSARQALRVRIIATDESQAGGDPFGDLPHHEVEIPGLGERTEDILPLAAHFLAEFADREGAAVVGFSEDARAALVGASWPGNVRELRERVRQAVRLARGGAVTAEAMMLAAETAEVPSFKEAKRAFETRYVEGLLRRCGGNISRAARLAKKDRKDFYDVIRRTGVDPQRFRG